MTPIDEIRCVGPEPPAPPPAEPSPGPARARGGGDRDVPALMARLEERLALEAAADGAEPVDVPPGHRPDAHGRLVPDRLIGPVDELEDATVRRILAFGLDLADQIARFRRHSYADVAALLDVLAEEYGAARKAGRKGNLSLMSYDGRLKVTIQVQERITFGPELEAARALVDECIAEWSAGVRPEVARLLQDAFRPDQQGRISREAVFRLRRTDIEDPRWKGVQKAISDAVRVVGTRTYLRLYLRGAPGARWRPVPIDISTDWTDTGQLVGMQVREAA